MKNELFTSVAEALSEAHQNAFGHRPLLDAYETLAIAQPQFGDIGSNIAMQVASTHGMSPLEVAQKLIEGMGENDLIESVDSVAPGFINIRLRSQSLLSPVTKIAHHWEEYVRALHTLGAGQTVAMDYSHPNIGKPMGVHHLLSTIIGDSVKRILLSTGHTVIADNFLGDIGTQFGKLIWAVKQWGSEADIEQDPITELQKLYVRFHIEADGDVALDDAGREEYRKLEDGDKENRALWHKIVQWSKAEIQPLYDELGVSFDYMHGESFYEDKMAPIIQQGIELGLFVESQGALVCLSDKPDDPPAIIRKADGATLYITRDLARIKYWEDTWQPDMMLVIVDIAQNFAQRQLYSVAKKLQLSDAELTQVNFGRMRFVDGAMSTRKGNILLLKDLIAEVKQRSLVLAQEKSHGLSQTELGELARVMGVGALKYNILSQNRLSDITFSWDTMLSLEGNSAPYVMYTAVRAHSLLSKAAGAPESRDGNVLESALGEQVERELALWIAAYSSHLSLAAREYRPHTLANYLYTLSQKYNSLYGSLPILDAAEPDRTVRLQLAAAVHAVLVHGLGCLGIDVPNKM